MARDDLMEIALYIAEDRPQRALSFVQELEQTCERLARAPGIGAARPELGHRVRMQPHGRYLIFYRQVGEQLRIERILHSARNIGAEDLSPPADDGH